MNKTKSLPSWSSPPSKRNTDYSDKQTNRILYTVAECYKEKQSIKKKQKERKKTRAGRRYKEVGWGAAFWEGSQRYS